MWSGAVFHLVLLHASCRERSVVVFLYTFTKFIPFSRTVIGGGPPFHRLESHISFKHSRWPTLFPKNVTRSLQTYVYLNKNSTFDLQECMAKVHVLRDMGLETQVPTQGLWQMAWVAKVRRCVELGMLKIYLSPWGGNNFGWKWIRHVNEKL